MMMVTIFFTQVALYQVNGDSNEEDSDNERDERKTINPDYSYLDSYSNYHQRLNNSAKKYPQDIKASDNTQGGKCNKGFAISEEKGECRNMYTWVM